MTKILYSPGCGAGWSTWADITPDAFINLEEPE